MNMHQVTTTWHLKRTCTGVDVFSSNETDGKRVFCWSPQGGLNGVTNGYTQLPDPQRFELGAACAKFFTEVCCPHGSKP